MTVNSSVRTFSLDVSSLPLLWGDQIQFNGFIFNDPRYLEKARIKSIDGLMDSDSADSRSDIPDADGEDAYDLVRRGRTLSFDGELVAGNLASLVNVRQRMKAALASKNLNTLWFNRFDWDETWATAYGSNGWALVSGSGANLTQDTTAKTLTTSGTDDLLLHRSLFPVPIESGRMVTKVTGGGASGFSYVGHVHSVVKSGTVTFANSTVTPRGAGLTADLIAAVFDPTLNSFQVWRVQNGQSLALVLPLVADVSPAPTTNYYFVSELRDNVITMSLWTADPRTDNTAVQLGSRTYTLTGGDATKYGNGVYNRTALWLGAQGGSSRQVTIAGHWIEGIDGSDVVALNVRRNGSVQGRESQDNYDIKRTFQFPLRAADGLLYSRYVEVDYITPQLAPNYGFSFNATFDLQFTQPMDSQGAISTVSTATVINLGDQYSFPEISIIGQVSGGITITNLTTGEIFKYNGTIDGGSWAKFDMRTGTYINSAGNDPSGGIDASSDRLSLAPGSNSILVTGTTFDTNARVVLRSRSAWA